MQPIQKVLKQHEALIHASKEIILNNQAPSGAYLASPNFFSYRYSWFRDGTFIAYAMNLSGDHESSARFHGWVVETVLKRVPLIRRLIEKSEQGLPINPGDLLRTRYTVSGEDALDEQEAWPNFQLDGFGTWLWGLNQHRILSGETLSPAWLEAAEWVGQYLRVLWERPCYDCWEEFPENMHTHTLAAIYGGFCALAELGFDSFQKDALAVKTFILEHCIYDGYFVKFVGSYTVDASLLGLAIPYQVIPLDDEVLLKTITRIEQSLLHAGGVQRYPTDTYFGGGEWVLLTAWLGWVYSELGQLDQALVCYQWITEQVNEKLELPEQVPLFLNDPNYYQPWVEKWGEIARPLLWSHAKLIILDHFLKKEPLS